MRKFYNDKINTSLRLGVTRACGIGLVATLTAMSATGANAAAFNEVSLGAGVSFEQFAEDQAPIGAGAAWADFDMDGNVDLFAVQAVGCNRMYRNLGGGNFAEVNGAGGAALCAEISRGIAVADFDNDGDQDIFIAQRDQNRLFKNRLIETGNATFVDITATAGMDNDGGRNSSSAVWGDFDKNGYLDLFVGSHRDFVLSPPGNPPICEEDYLWMNNGDGTFTDIAGATGIGMSGELNKVGCALAAVWTDYDADNDLDLLIQNDFGEVNAAPNRLFRNDGPDGLGGWIFDDQSSESAIDFAQAGMGIAIGDLDRDGTFDYYLSDRGANELAHNNGNGTFDEIAEAAGVQAIDAEIYGEAGLVSWGNGFFDLDRDGWEELVIANGGAPREIWPGGMFGADYIDNNPAYVYRNNKNSTFTELHTALGVLAEGYFRTAVFADYDNDGDMDFYLGNLHGMNALYKNDFPTANRWLKVKAVGTIGNRDGIGTRISISANDESQMREVSGGSGFLSRNMLTTHFGLGDANKVSFLRADFLSGLWTEYANVGANQTLTVTEPVLTTVLDAEQYAVVAGNTYPIDITATNLKSVPQSTQVWVERVGPNGGQNTIFGPITINMQADGSFVRSLNFPTNAALPAGTYTLMLRNGTYPDTLIHQDISYLEVSVAP